MRKRGAWIVAAAIAAAVGVGCGGSRDQSSTVAEVTANPSITKAEFRRQANAICNEGKKEITLTLVRRAEASGKTSAQEVDPAEQSEVLLANLREQLTKIRELGSPPSDKGKVEAFVKAFEDAIEEIDEKDLQGIEEIQPVLVTIYKPAMAYGLPGCGYGH